MKDFSIERGVKELRGDYGTFEFRDNGCMWQVFEKTAEFLGMPGRFVFRFNLSKRPRETNDALYERAKEASWYMDESDEYETGF